MMLDFLVNEMHLHAFSFNDLDQIVNMIDETNYELAVVHSLSSTGGKRLANNFVCAALKAMLPKKMFAYGSFDYPENGGAFTPEKALEQIKNLMLCGFDGVKMLEGKPDTHKRIGVPLNSSYYEPSFCYMEKENIPLVWHVGDPEEFWDEKLCPDWAKERGYDWIGGNYTPKEEIEREALDVAERHPNLKIIFAHWFFQSASCEKSIELLERYPNVSLDIVPGWEMYGNFTNDYDKFRNFFIKYSDRIYYGTDNLMVNWREIISGVKRFLTTEDSFTAGEIGIVYSEPDMMIRGFNLPQETLKDIMRDNFLKVHQIPKELDVDRILAWAKHFGEENKNAPELAAAIERIKDCSERS